MEYCIYELTITRIGEEAKSLLQDHNMMVIFGPDIPDSLIDVCYVHDSKEMKEEIEIGDKVYFDNQEYEVVEIGNVANENLATMGHCTFKFNVDVDEEKILGGTIYLKGENVPAVNLGSTIKIFKNA
ncbi:PTS glucitol/sorbitol transporter subunit IIA [Tepidimicrobium xylanilyticum]|uniref:PTS system, glucitol/sorbitol-specific IIA component n=1 Tax=Tepidimicrobium xylanilyticum TaxID=1123352 RepID=A0A1H2W461_9FIRM|nr:PTS glucitol/sorbitol transporter subunit IIA [Tepidimicrobium xylanilyticum]SDW75301.1 PTS system, glucitol/sorbitol-specific IIA component [Tepidimicrobium xylanilyticum]